MKKTYIVSAMIHATFALKSMTRLFGSNKENKLIHAYQYPNMHSGKRTGFAAARHMAKKTRNIRARAKK